MTWSNNTRMANKTLHCAIKLPVSSSVMSNWAAILLIETVSTCGLGALHGGSFYSKTHQLTRPSAVTLIGLGN